MSISESDISLKTSCDNALYNSIAANVIHPYVVGKKMDTPYTVDEMVGSMKGLDRAEADTSRQRAVAELLSRNKVPLLQPTAAEWSSMQEHERLRRDIHISVAGHKARMLAQLKAAAHRFDEMEYRHR